MFRSLLHSARLREWSAQAALLAVLVALVWWIGGNTATNLAERGIRTGLDFLSRPARFPISESVLRYDPSDSFLWAYAVGVTNTLWLSFLTILLATILGLFVGLSRRSRHPLLSRIATLYVTVLRNVPLLVQLLFWYGITTSLFPAPREALEPLPGVFLSLRGVYAPSLVVEPGGFGFLIGATLMLAVACGVGLRAVRRGTRAGIAVVGALVGWLAASSLLFLALGAPLSLLAPEFKGLNFVGGTYFSPEFAAILFGLTLYTAAFIGEIIRGGIDSIGKGQWEGSRALGLRERQTVFKVVLPQALRVIVPPMTSQYLSTVKNTTLALAVGYPELGLVVNTVTNQTGQALESILIMLAVYLSISLSVSIFMNWYNAHVALVER